MEHEFCGTGLIAEHPKIICFALDKMRRFTNGKMRENEVVASWGEGGGGALQSLRRIVGPVEALSKDDASGNGNATKQSVK